MPKVTFRLSEDLDEQIENHLSYGDSKSAWIRKAIQNHLDDK
jgi:Arc/MetJ-type ribon-helix-helix transcriptional regulator